MTILHQVNDFLYSLFPETELFGQDPDRLAEYLTDYYTYGPYRPKVMVQEGVVTVLIDTRAIDNQQGEYNKVLKMCEAGQFAQALPRLRKLIEQNPTVSEYHRVLGQVLSEMGSSDAAIDALIDALRWDPRNGYALIMLGNIYARTKNDITAANKFYDQALAVNPKDFIAINNIGGNLMQLGRAQEAQRYFEIAHEINPNYPNVLYALAMTRQQQRDYTGAFGFASQALRNAGAGDPIRKASLALLMQTAKQQAGSTNTFSLADEYQERLEAASAKEIRVDADERIPTAAKLEVAENYRRPYHQIWFKPSYPAVNHLVMHEMVHLDFIVQAREEGNNLLFTTTGAAKQAFTKTALPQLKKLEKAGYSEGNITGFIDSVYDGMMRQMYNAPIDLFIEDFLYREYEELRPTQFLSLHKLLLEYIDAARNKQVATFSPPAVHRANTVLNLVAAIHFKELFGYDLTRDFQASVADLKEAQRLWKEYEEYRADRQPGEEYELVQHWGKDLGMAAYFELKDEASVRGDVATGWAQPEGARNQPTANADYTAEPNGEQSPEEVLAAIERDPLGLDTPPPADALKEPLSYDDSPAGQMAVMFYCLDALKYFASVSRDQLQTVAFEIALLGRSGLDPNNRTSKYNLASLPGKTFSALQLLAWMYTGFQELEPGMDTGLDFAKELEMARTMASGKS
ncbi:tetratricopeptide repeat protein [Hymenobacter sp. BT188]|uniref:tetratricopeptide repeat protein n=1 Tax=Hymenobacter sp. BT188 TaxID=2763504 RepID=UPI0016516E56|nr:tetratricopeptide repeat protein [Hymenobacter sp. BT188]MBC6609094.1 tetratricopeptide repeat protein [Hymenobacter sp. BT188]